MLKEFQQIKEIIFSIIFNQAIAPGFQIRNTVIYDTKKIVGALDDICDGLKNKINDCKDKIKSASIKEIEDKLAVDISKLQDELDAMMLVVLVNLTNWEIENIDTYIQPSQKGNIIKYIYHQLNEFQEFLQKEMFIFYDFERVVSFQEKLIQKNRSRSDSKFIIKATLNIESSLVEIFLEPVKKMQKLSEIIDTDRMQILFLRNFIESFKKLIEENAHIKEAELINFGIQSNFNSQRFARYLMNKIYNEAVAPGVVELRKEYLRKSFYFFHDLKDQKIRYYSNLPHLKDQMLQYLDEELKGIGCHIKSERASPYLPEIKEKLKTTLSVDNLAYLIKVEYEVGIVSYSNRKKMVELFCQNLSSLQQDKISSNSLLSKYYNPGTGTKLAVRKLLKKMLLYVENDLENS